MPLIGWFKAAGPSGFGHNSTAEQVTAGIDLRGRTVLITGVRGGIGLETLRVLGLRGAYIIAAARSEAQARKALDEASVQGTPVGFDLSEPDQVRAGVEQVRALGRLLDAVVCNAGIMALPTLHQKHGLELQFLTNHLGHYLLITGLLDQLAPRGRVVMVASSAHRAAPRGGIQFDNLHGQAGYGPWRNYGQSKLANILFARALSRRLPQAGQTANALHPGVIRTDLARHMSPVIAMAMKVLRPIAFKTIAQGAATQCYAAVHPDVAEFNGAYFKDCAPAQPTAAARDDALAERLWAVSAEWAERLE